MGGKSSQSTQTVSIPPQVLAQYQAVTARSNQIDQTPFQQYGGEFVSPLTSTQNAGIANTNAAAGQAQPYYGAATGYTLAGGQNVNAQQIGGQQIGQFMSPYLSDVVGSEAALLNQNNQQAMSGQLGNAIQQGAFGGDRAGIAAANLNQQQNLANSQIYSGLLNQGFNTALGAAQQQQGVNLSAEQANRQALQQTGQSLAGLGAGAQTAALQGAQAQMAAGQVQQQYGQALDTALYNQFQQQQSLPYQQLQQQANIAEGIGANSGSTTTGSSITSDRRAKHDVHEIGKTFDGQPIYSYKYNGDNTTQIGLMAQDVEKKHPGAVGLAGGFKNVDYAKATAGAARRGHFADGGGIDVPNTPPALPGPQDDKQKGPAGSASGSSVPSWLQDAVAATQVTANINNSFPDPFARGGTAGNSEGGVVHEGHFGEGYAGGGLIGGYGESPFIGYDPTAAYQAMYGGLLSPHGTGVTGGAGINVPSSGGSGGTLNAPKLSMEMPDPLKGASQIVGLANGIGQMGDAAHLWNYGSKDQAQGSGAKSPNSGTMSRKDKQSSDESWADVAQHRPGEAQPAEAQPAEAQADDAPVAEAQGSDHPDYLDYSRGGLAAGRYHRDIGGGLPYSGDSDGIQVPDDQSPAKLQASHLKTPNTPDTGKQAGKVMTTLGTILDFIPGMQPIGMGLQAAGTVSSAFARGGDVGDFVDSADGSMPGDEDEKFIHELLQHALHKDNGDGTQTQQPSAPQSIAAPAPVTANAPSGNGLAGGLKATIMHGEGTDKFSNPYDVVYGANPRTGLSPYANPQGHLSSMPMGDVQDFQKKLIGVTRGKVRGLAPNEGTGAVGAYQFTRDTLANLAHKLYGDNWRSTQFTPEVQDALASELAKERHGDLSGTWAAFRDSGPAGSKLRAQAGYATGGVAGRKGYAAGFGVDGNYAGGLGDNYNSDNSDDDYVQTQGSGSSPGNMSPEDFLATQVDQTGSPAHAASGYGSQSAPQASPSGGYAEKLSGIVAPYLDTGQAPAPQKQDFIKGIGRGEASSWLPLLAGLAGLAGGAGYKGSLGGALQAGVGTAARQQEYGLKKRQLEMAQELGRGNLGVSRANSALAPERLTLEQLGIVAPLMQNFAGRFRPVTETINGQPVTMMVDSMPNPGLGEDSQGRMTMDQYNRVLGQHAQRVSAMSGVPAESLMGISGFTSPGPSGVSPKNPGTPSAGGSVLDNPPAQDATNAAHPVRVKHVHAAPQLPPKVTAAPSDGRPAWLHSENYDTPAASLPMPPRTPGVRYTPETDPDLMRLRINKGAPLPGDVENLSAWNRHQFVPQIPGIGDDPRVRQWQGQEVQRAMQIKSDGDAATNFWNQSKNENAQHDVFSNASGRLLSTIKTVDPSQYGNGAVAQLSHALAPYGVTSGNTAKALGDARTAFDVVRAQANSLKDRTGGIIDVGAMIPQPPPGSSTAANMHYVTVMSRALERYAHDYTNDFSTNYNDAPNRGQQFGQMRKFTSDWTHDHHLRDYISTQIHEDGFAKGMTAPEKSYWGQYLPEIDPNNPPPKNQKGLYKHKNGFVSFKYGHAKVGPDPEFNP